MAEANGLRAGMHAMWGSVAPAWEAHSEYVDARSAALTARMLEIAAPQPGDRVLELACGAGGVGLAAASLVGETGEVVLSDVAEEMLAIAGARAAARGLTNVRTRQLDLEEINEPDASYDVVLCREGLMFATDHARACREIARVLRTGGRVAIATWGPRAENPWLGIVLDEVGAQLGMQVPPPGIPGPFALADGAALAELLRAAGLTDVAVDAFPMSQDASSFDDWWTRTSALAGPIAGILAALDNDSAQALRARLEQAVQPYTSPTGLTFPGVSNLASARCG
jgi:ubiquinone/menaquinone biosynthesis C-methylase UbiE